MIYILLPPTKIHRRTCGGPSPKSHPPLIIKSRSLLVLLLQLMHWIRRRKLYCSRIILFSKYMGPQCDIREKDLVHINSLHVRLVTVLLPLSPVHSFSLIKFTVHMFLLRCQDSVQGARRCFLPLRQRRRCPVHRRSYGTRPPHAPSTPTQSSWKESMSTNCFCSLFSLMSTDLA
jgi:hypothetical protein